MILEVKHHYVVIYVDTVIGGAFFRPVGCSLHTYLGFKWGP